MRIGIKGGLLISIIIHILILGVYIWYITPKVEKKSITKQKISLDISKFQTLPPKPTTTPKPTISKPIHATKPTPATSPPTPLQQQKSQSKPVVKQRSDTPPPTPKAITTKDAKIKVADSKKVKSKTKAKKETKKITKADKNIKIEKPTQVTKQSKPKKSQKVTKQSKPIKRTKPTKSRHTRIRPKGPNSKLINSLYGSSYSRMSRAQRRYIDRYLAEIIRISQRTLNYLGYPQEAIALRQQGTNIVEFWLHPNGDISGLRLKRRLRAESLNRQTIEVIKTAYMYYPHPPVKTKIIIYVGYRLY